MEIVYVLEKYWTKDYNDFNRVCGVYSSEEKALAAKAIEESIPQHHKVTYRGFDISRYEIDNIEGTCYKI